MLVVINALKSITRAKGRNVLIGIVIFSIAASSCVALAIRNAAHEAQLASRDALTITASIVVDREKQMVEAQNAGSGGVPDMESMREMMDRYQDLELEELKQYAESDYVTDFFYSTSLSLDASGDLEPYSAQGSSSDADDADADDADSDFFDAVVPGGPGASGMVPQEGKGALVFSGRMMAMGDFTVTGYSSEGAMDKFVSGTAEITDGVLFDAASADTLCLMSSELAAFNGLGIGDTITLANPNAGDETYELTISGIYTDSSSSQSSGIPMFSTSMDPANLICVSFETARSIIDQSAEDAQQGTDSNGFEYTTELSGQLASTLVFSSKDDFDRFSEELRAKGLSEYYVLSSSDIRNYESSLIPLQNLSAFATTLLWIVLGIGAVVLIVINVFNIRERKYEVGVLTAIGIKKPVVASQFVTELLCVTLIAILLGAAVGSALSVPVSNNLLSAQIEQAQAQNQEQGFGGPGAGLSGSGGPGGGPNVSVGGPPGGMMMVFGADNQADITYLDKINATVDPTVLGQLIAIGIALTLISSLATVVFVMRYEPLKILANRT